MLENAAQPQRATRDTKYHDSHEAREVMPPKQDVRILHRSNGTLCFVWSSTPQQIEGDAKQKQKEEERTLIFCNRANIRCPQGS